MKVFYISGVSNSGKSASIKYTMKMLLKLKSCEVLYVSSFRRKDKGYHCDKNYLIGHINTSIEKGLDADKNIGLIIIQTGDKIIGLTTYGDSLNSEVKDNLQKAIDEVKGKLDAFICARHDCNDVSEELKEFRSQVGEIIVHEPVHSEKISGSIKDFDADNRRKGKELYEKIVSELKISTK